MSANECFSVSANVSFKQIADESVLLDLASGTYFGLNTMGTRIWTLLVAGKSITAVCDAIEFEYASERATIDKDVRALVQTLVDKQLLVQSAV